MNTEITICPLISFPNHISWQDIENEYIKLKKEFSLIPNFGLWKLLDCHGDHGRLIAKNKEDILLSLPSRIGKSIERMPNSIEEDEDIEDKYVVYDYYYDRRLEFVESSDIVDWNLDYGAKGYYDIEDWILDLAYKKDLPNSIKNNYRVSIEKYKYLIRVTADINLLEPHPIFALSLIMSKIVEGIIIIRYNFVEEVIPAGYYTFKELEVVLSKYYIT